MRILKTDQYDQWFKKLKDAAAKARINARIRRIELRVNTGPGTASTVM